MKNKPFFKFIIGVVFFLLINCVLTNTTFAQAGNESFFRIGAKAGVNINKISGKSYKDAFNYNFQAGVFAQLNITKKIGLQPEVNFVQTQSEYTDDANTIYDETNFNDTICFILFCSL